MVELSELPHIIVTATTANSPKVTQEPSAHEYWTYLKNHFEKNDRVLAVLNYMQYVSICFVNNGKLEEQMNTYQELCPRCTLNSYKLEEFIHTTHMLIALPNTPSYKLIKDYFFTSISHNRLKLDDF